MPHLEREGVALFYDEAGRGEPQFLFIHGWMCDRSHFAPQMERFSRVGRCVAVDLRGHGQSDKPRQDYTMGAFADDLQWLCEQLDIRRPIVAGHSMGGVVALTLAAAHPDLLKAVVALDCPICMTPKHHAALQRASEPFHGADYAGRVRRFVENMFLPTDGPKRRARIVDTMLAGPQHVGASAFDGLLASAVSLVDSMPRVEVPVLAIASAGGHMANLERLREMTPQLVTGQTVGAGHFLQLEAPDQVNSMIERFLLLIQDGKPESG